MTDLVNEDCVVTDDSMLYSLGFVWCIWSILVQMKYNGCDQVIIQMCFVCLLANQHSAFK